MSWGAAEGVSCKVFESSLTGELTNEFNAAWHRWIRRATNWAFSKADGVAKVFYLHDELCRSGIRVVKEAIVEYVVASRRQGG